MPVKNVATQKKCGAVHTFSLHSTSLFWFSQILGVGVGRGEMEAGPVLELNELSHTDAKH